ncbi:hypothetical protein GCM10027194_31420 [Thalassiella azotivora]
MSTHATAPQRGGPTSWNVRDVHMADTLDAVAEHHAEVAGGTPVRAVVWEHNTHVGDARFTDMATAGMVNVGQLVRERHGERDVVLVGFATHRGTVVAADAWGEPATAMRLPAARRGSLEHLLHETVPGGAALFVPGGDRAGGWAAETLDHRAVGVVYHPDREPWGNYVPTVAGRRYDALLWLDETTALAPVHGVRPHGEELEAYPTGQ